MTGGLDWTGLNERMELGCCGRKCKATKATSSNSRGGPLKVKGRRPLTGTATSQKQASGTTGPPLRTELLIAACNGPGGEIRKVGTGRQ